MRTKTIDLAIADKSPLVLAGLTQMFGEDDRFNLLATAADGERFMEAIDRLSFDVGVIGWQMPYMDGGEVLEALGEREDSPRSVVYTGEPSASVPRRVMLKGGAGFCSKRDRPEILLETVLAVAEGRMAFPFMDMSKPQEDPFGTLTAKEKELLAPLAAGLTNAAIARELDISINTVKFHLKNLFGKIGVANRAQAVAIYFRGGP